MTFSDNDFNYFSQNQLTKFSACSLNNTDKTRRRKKSASKASRKNGAIVRRIVAFCVMRF